MIVAGLLPTIVAPVALAATPFPIDDIHAGTDNGNLYNEVCNKADFNFVIDMSGSIGAQPGRPSNLGQLQTGITDFVEQFAGDAIYSGTRFNGNGATNLTTGYDSATAFKAEIAALSNPNGMTPTAAGINTGASNNGGDRAGVPNIMFVVTDGSPNKPNTHSDDLNNPDTWLTAANAAIDAANAVRAGSGASKYFVRAVYLSTPTDPGDTNLPWADSQDAQWAAKVMDQIDGGPEGALSADFGNFAKDLFKAIGCKPPSLEIEKTADNTTVDAGAEIGFTIKVTNSSPDSDAQDVVVTDKLPDKADTNWKIDPAVEACEITGAPGEGQVLTCNFGDVAKGGGHESVHVVTDTGKSCGTYDNTAEFTAEGLDPNTASASVEVLCAGIGITKVADAASVIAGDPIGFTITVTSKGPATATASSSRTCSRPMPAPTGRSTAAPPRTSARCHRQDHL